MTDSATALNDLKASGNLPGMPQILARLIDACHQQEVDLHQVADIVSKDSSLSAKILQLVNSAFIGTRSRFTTVRQAVIYLGADTVRNLAVSVSVQQVFRHVSGRRLALDRFWCHSYENGLLARQIAQAVNYHDPSEAYLGGLLHDIGKLVLWLAFPDKYAPLLPGHDNTADPVALERETVHIDHCQAGAWLMEQWRLPSLLADAIRFHHQPIEELQQGLPLPRIVSLADLLSHCRPRQCEEAARRLLDLTPHQVASLSEGIEEQLQEVAHSLGIRIPAKEHPAPEQEPDQGTPPQEPSADLIARIKEITQLTGLLDNLLRAEDRMQIVGAVERGMKILFNEDTCFLLLQDDREKKLHGVATPDNRLASQAARISFRPDDHKESLATQAINQGRAVHSFMEDRPNPTLLDNQLVRLLGSKGMAMVPMLHQKQVMGLIVIGLDTSRSSLLKQSGPLRLLAGQAAAALSLQRLHQLQAERIAEERIATAAMIARRIAHEINNPLAVLRNYMKILDIKLGDNEAVRDDLAAIDQEFARIGQITDQLNDLGTDRSLILVQRLDLNQLLEESLRLYRKSLPPDQDIELRFEPDPTLPEIESDPDCIRQILLNLLNNAVDAIQDQGTITVALRAQYQEDQNTSSVLLTVADTGPGIPAALVPTLFDAGISTKECGHSGLGLAIVRRIAAQLGGTVTCSSSEKGTIFRVSLPLRHT